MTSHEYWQRRARWSKRATVSTAERETAAIDRDIRRARQELEDEASAILGRYGADLGLAKQVQKGKTREQALAQYYRLVSKALHGKPEAKAAADRLLNAINAERRLTRIDLALADLDVYAARLGLHIEEATRALLDKVTADAYYRHMFSYQMASEGVFDFSRISAEQVAGITGELWSGEHWSKRLWGHIDDFGTKLKGIVRASVLQGRSIDYMANELTKLTGGTRSSVRRLVRTEAAHCAEQGTLAAYAETGVERYQYEATLDEKTSRQCQALSGQTFSIADAQEGMNYPPLHPNCRSTTIPVVEGMDTGHDFRRVLNPKTGKVDRVPVDITYKEWREKYVDIKHEGYVLLPQHPASDISKAINEGKYSTKLSVQQYNKHIQGTPQYEQYLESRRAKGQGPQSILLLSAKEIQDIITSNAGTGIRRSSRKGEPQPIEDISCNRVIGRYFESGEWHDTNKASIRYGKKNAHITPIKGANYD